MSSGWAAYEPLSSESLEVPAVSSPEPLRLELADIGRLGFRGLRAVVKAARADQATLSRVLLEHFGQVSTDWTIVEEVWRPYDHVNVQAGLDAWLAGRRRSHRLVGVTGFQHHEFGLADLLVQEPLHGPFGPRPGNVAVTNLACGPDGAVRRCVACGIYLVTEGAQRTALLLRGPDEHGMHSAVTLQIVSPDPDASGRVAAQVRQAALEHNVFRGHVLSFGGDVFESGRSLLQFHRRPHLEREQLILLPDTLEAIERQVVGVARRRQRLLASRQHLKRGLLLFGPPGTGKTHTLRYLLGRVPDATVLQLTGDALHLIEEACSVARALQPALIIIEDVDLIAEERDVVPGEHPLLFQLLNEMDGLAEDADVAFVLTTNRPDLLEPALAARPGRVDQAVELALPDADARRALLELYRGLLELDVSKIDEVVARTEGVTASFLKELLRRAAVIAADAVDGDDAEGPLTVSAAQLDSALDELLDTRNAMTRVLLGGTAERRGRPSGPQRAQPGVAPFRRPPPLP